MKGGVLHIRCLLVGIERGDSIFGEHNCPFTQLLLRESDKRISRRVQDKQCCVRRKFYCFTK